MRFEHGERMVGGWLAQRMLKGSPSASKEGARIARHFNDAGIHESHGRRIDRDEARKAYKTWFWLLIT
jgi:hypothetical protein